MARSQDPNSNGSQFFIVQNTDDMHDGLLKTTILKQSSTLIKRRLSFTRWPLYCLRPSD